MKIPEGGSIQDDLNLSGNSWCSHHLQGRSVMSKATFLRLCSHRLSKGARTAPFARTSAIYRCSHCTFC